MKGEQGEYLPKDRLNYWLERHEHPVVKVPTQWHVTTPVTIGWMKEYDYLSDIYSQIADLPGDIAECGLGEGNTFAMLARRIGKEGKGRVLYGFDSFEGWPEPDPLDMISPLKPKKGTFKVNEELVRRYLEDSGIVEAYPNMHIEIKRGFLRDSLPKYIEENPDAELALVHADVDLYEGYRDIFKHLWDHVVKGGIVALDEYKEFPPLQEYGNGTNEKWPGCTKAVDDFFRDRPEKPQYYPETDKWYVVKGTD